MPRPGFGPIRPISLLLLLAPLAMAPVAFAATSPASLNVPAEEDTSTGVEPPGLPPPPSDPRELEGDWYPFSAPPPAGSHAPAPGSAGGAYPPGRPDVSSIFANNENKPDSTELCGGSPLFLGTMGVAIVQSPNAIVVANEESGDYRVILLHGHHPSDLPPDRKGNSIGHWDGSTLVVDVTGFTLQSGAPSDARVTEHLYKDQNNTRLNDVVDVYYPSTGKHETRTSTYRWRPDLKVSEEICEEGYSDFQIKNGKLIIEADQ